MAPTLPAALVVLLAVLLALCAGPARGSTPDDTHYVAAVVDFAAPVMTGKPALENIMANIDAMGKMTQQAAEQGADIIVFAEDGLQGMGNQRLPMAVQANSTPCDWTDGHDQPLHDLSCLAKKNKIYLVVNLVDKQPCAAGDSKCLAKGSYNYNTNVVFDRSGQIVAKYHKYNLFGEYSNDVPPAVEYVEFDTDFGVRFGMFICFDILFDKPSAELVRQRNITDIVYSAAWFSEVPFLTAVQAHSGWAHALDATVLASGFNNPSGGSTGSGIYRGRHGILKYTMNWRKQHKLLVSRVPKHGHWGDDATLPQPRLERLDPVLNYGAGNTDPYEEMKALRMIQDNLTMYKSVELERPAQDRPVDSLGKICHNDFCCTYAVKTRGVKLFQTTSAAVSLHGGHSRPRDAPTYNEEDAEEHFDGFYYRVVAFDGVRDHSKVATTGVQVCGIISCLSKDIHSCGWLAPGLDSPAIQWTEFQSIRLMANYRDKDTLQFASTLAGPRYDPLPANVYSLQSELAADTGMRKVVLSLKQPQPLLDLRTFTIYGRNFVRDGERPTGS